MWLIVHNVAHRTNVHKTLTQTTITKVRPTRVVKVSIFTEKIPFENTVWDKKYRFSSARIARSARHRRVWYRRPVPDTAVAGAEGDPDYCWRENRSPAQWYVWDRRARWTGNLHSRTHGLGNLGLLICNNQGSPFARVAAVVPAASLG